MLAVGVLEITIIFNRDSDIQNFLEWRRFAQWKLNRIGWDFEIEPWKGSCCLRRGISEAWRSGEKTLDV